MTYVLFRTVLIWYSDSFR